MTLRITIALCLICVSQVAPLLICAGPFACADITYQCGAVECLVECRDTNSCFNLTVACEQSPNCAIQCLAPNACDGLTVADEVDSDPCSIHTLCSEDLACANAFLNDTQSLICQTGQMSCQNAILPGEPLCTSPFQVCDPPLPEELITPFSTCLNNTWEIITDLTIEDLSIPDTVDSIIIAGNLSVTSSLTITSQSEGVLVIGGCFQFNGTLFIDQFNANNTQGDQISFTLGTSNNSQDCPSPVLGGATLETNNLCLDLVEQADPDGDCPSADVHYEGPSIVVLVENSEEDCKSTSCLFDDDDEARSFFSTILGTTIGGLGVVCTLCVCLCFFLCMVLVVCMPFFAAIGACRKGMNRDVMINFSESSLEDFPSFSTGNYDEDHTSTVGPSQSASVIMRSTRKKPFERVTIEDLFDDSDEEFAELESGGQTPVGSDERLLTE